MKQLSQKQLKEKIYDVLHVFSLLTLKISNKINERIRLLFSDSQSPENYKIVVLKAAIIYQVPGLDLPSILTFVIAHAMLNKHRYNDHSSFKSEHCVFPRIILTGVGYNASSNRRKYKI